MQVTSSPTVGVGCLALTLSNRAPVPRTVRASISHCRSDLRNQRDAEQSGRSRSPDLSFFFPTVFSLPRMYFRSSFLSVHAAFHIQPISVTWQRRASSCSLGNADLQGAQDWNFWFSLIMPKISEMVTKNGSYILCSSGPETSPTELFTPTRETQFTLGAYNRPHLSP